MKTLMSTKRSEIIVKGSVQLFASCLNTLSNSIYFGLAPIDKLEEKGKFPAYLYTKRHR